MSAMNSDMGLRGLTDGYSTISDCTIATSHFNQRYKTLILSRERGDKVPSQLDPSDLTIYTDGLEMNLGSGVRIYSEKINLKV